MSSRSACRSMFGNCQSDIRSQTRTSEDLPVNRQAAAFTLEQLGYLETCLKEAEEKANALLEQNLLERITQKMESGFGCLRAKTAGAKALRWEEMIKLKPSERMAVGVALELTASEEAKLQLLEKVSLLEKRLQAMSQRSAGGESYENMVLEKDKCIEKLQAEVKASQEKLTAHKLKYKKTVKKLQTDLAIAKQEATITVLELNEKIKTLCEGRPCPRASSSVEVPYGGLPPVEEGDRKISLIMELSTQLSLQTEKITQLEEVLAEKEQKIEELVAKRSDQLSQKDANLTEDLQELPVVRDDRSVPVASDEEM